MLGVLDNYREIFDVDYYLNNKIEYFGLLHIRKSFDELTKPIYKYFLQKEPELILKPKLHFLRMLKIYQMQSLKVNIE